MKTADKEHEMAGMPIGTPGSAEGTDDDHDQSQVPPAAHTPGSAEGEDDDTIRPNKQETRAPMGRVFCFISSLDVSH